MAFNKIRCLLAAVLIAGIALPAQAGVLKIATLSPDGSNWMRKMREGAQKVAQATDNRVRFKFYPGGVMGNDMAVLRKIRIGQLQGLSPAAHLRTTTAMLRSTACRCCSNRAPKSTTFVNAWTATSSRAWPKTGS